MTSKQKVGLKSMPANKITFNDNVFLCKLT